MNGRITEDIFYSLAPELTPQAAQSIGKARSRLLSVPGLKPESSHSARNQMCFGHLFSSQSGVKAVCNQSKPFFGQPLMKLFDHFLDKFYQCWPVLSMQSHIYRQSQRFCTPWRLNLQCQNYPIETTGTYNVLFCRANSILPVTCAIDFSAAMMKQSIVQSDSNDTCRTKKFDQHQCQNLSEFVDVPSGIWKKTVISILSTMKIWVGKWHDTGYGSSSSTQNPAGRQSRENMGTRSGKNWKKLLNYIRPCRNNICNIHSNLHVVTFPLLRSDGFHFFVYDSWPKTPKKCES